MGDVITISAKELAELENYAVGLLKIASRLRKKPEPVQVQAARKGKIGARQRRIMERTAASLRSR